ncbi:hypothetical protein MYO4S_00061 [Serratia phage 4S]|nr:hypothetical protein MYO4S_00061 [Serratia phage 4S]
MTEQERFDSFLEVNAQRRAKHVNNIHPECTGCKIGLKWTLSEDLELFSYLKMHPFNLMKISEQMDRPIWGIMSRLQRLGVVSKYHSYYSTADRTFKVSKAKKRINLTEQHIDALVNLGWYNDKHKLDAPKWWYSKSIIIK